MDAPEPPGPPAVRALVSPRPGVAAPAACHALDDTVGTYLQSMMALETGRLSVVVEEAAGVAD